MALYGLGVALEAPVAIVLLCWMGITTPERFCVKTALYPRPWGIHCGNAAYAARCFLANLLAIPMYRLFEIGVFCSRFYVSALIMR